MGASVRDRVVIVTGASKGVGRGIALHLAREGARLVVLARRPDPLAALSSELDALGTEHLAATLNVADRDANFALVEDTIAIFGRVDGLVANAQTFRPPTPLADLTVRDVDVLFDTGPKGTLWGMQAVFPHMRDQGWGRIVTMGSNSGFTTPAGYARVGPVWRRRELRVPGLDRPSRAARRRPAPRRFASAHLRESADLEGR